MPTAKSICCSWRSIWAGMGINEVLVEAGINLDSALLRAGVVDELLLYLAPLLLGDAGRGMLDLGELTRMDQRLRTRTFETPHDRSGLADCARPVDLEQGLMFTGIIQAIGRIAELKPAGQSAVR